MPLSGQEVHLAHCDATGKHYLAYRTCPCILRLNVNNRWRLKCRRLQKSHAQTAIRGCRLTFGFVEIADFDFLKAWPVMPAKRMPAVMNCLPLFCRPRRPKRNVVLAVCRGSLWACSCFSLPLRRLLRLSRRNGVGVLVLYKRRWLSRISALINSTTQTRV